MTHAEQTAGPTCNADDLNSADAVLRLLFEDVLQKWDAPFGPDPFEGVHELRVATRRIRSALRNLSFLLKKKPLRQLKNDLRRIADALGAARDQDVAIIALEKLRNEPIAENIRDGIAELIERRAALREHAQAGLLTALSADALEELRELFDRSIIKAARRKRSARPFTFNQAGRKVVGKTVAEFCELSRNIYRPFNDKALHELRIAAKRLRYAIELYRSCWGEQIDPFAAGVAEMQDFLGKVHDANVWLENLGGSLDDSKQVNPAHIWLLSEFVEKRTKNYRAVLRLYSDWKDSGFVKRLVSIVSQAD